MILFYVLCLILWLLFVLPFPLLPLGKPTKKRFVSIIIPARNEENNLPILLFSIFKQNYKNYEVIVVDDFSEDRTEDIARKFGAKVVKINKEDNCFGKPYACFKGYEESKGELLLFLDADVVLEEDALERLLKAYEIYDSTVSVWPYHKIKHFYENLSMFFNVIGAISLNNFSFVNRLFKPDGLFGPCILIERKIYENIGGHKKVLNEVLEDLALGKELIKNNYKIKNFLGYKTISFRMYPSGIRDLIQGWGKNFSKGSVSINPAKFLLIFIYISALLSVTINIKDYYLFYMLFAIELFLTTKIIGNFHFLLSLFFPFTLFSFFVIFFYSTILNFVKRKVFWKGRELKI